MEQLKRQMALAGLLTIAAEALVSYIILSLLGISPWVLLVVLPVFWLGQWLVAPYLIGRGAREVTNDPSFSWLREMARDIAARSGVKEPRLYITDDPFPNAYAFGNLIT